MKKLFVIILSLTVLAACNDTEMEIQSTDVISLDLIESCLVNCSIQYYPNNLEESNLSCGEISVSFQDGYIDLCFEPDTYIIEFIGWYPLNHSEYYNKFWSFDIDENCLYFQPNDSNLQTDIMEFGFQLDIVLCINPSPLELLST